MKLSTVFVAMALVIALPACASNSTNATSASAAGNGTTTPMPTPTYASNYTNHTSPPSGNGTANVTRAPSTTAAPPGHHFPPHIPFTLTKTLHLDEEPAGQPAQPNTPMPTPTYAANRSSNTTAPPSTVNGTATPMPTPTYASNYTNFTSPPGAAGNGSTRMPTPTYVTNHTNHTSPPSGNGTTNVTSAPNTTGRHFPPYIPFTLTKTLHLDEEPAGQPAQPNPPMPTPTYAANRSTNTTAPPSTVNGTATPMPTPTYASNYTNFTSPPRGVGNGTTRMPTPTYVTNHTNGTSRPSGNGTANVTLPPSTRPHVQPYVPLTLTKTPHLDEEPTAQPAQQNTPMPTPTFVGNSSANGTQLNTTTLNRTTVGTLSVNGSAASWTTVLSNATRRAALNATLTEKIARYCGVARSQVVITQFRIASLHVEFTVVGAAAAMKLREPNVTKDLCEAVTSEYSASASANGTGGESVACRGLVAEEKAVEVPTTALNIRAGANPVPTTPDARSSVGDADRQGAGNSATVAVAAGVGSGVLLVSLVALAAFLVVRQRRRIAPSTSKCEPTVTNDDEAVDTTTVVEMIVCDDEASGTNTATAVV